MVTEDEHNECVPPIGTEIRKKKMAKEIFVDGLHAKLPWCLHVMETLFRITGPLLGETTGGFPHNGSVMRNVDVSFVASLSNLLNTQWSCR